MTRRAKNVPIVGIVVTISPSLSLYKMVVLPAASRPTCVRFSAFYDERRISSVSTKEGEKKFRATDGLEEYIPRVQKATTTRPRDEARRPMFHRIGSPRIRKQSPHAAFFFVRSVRPPVLRARNSKSNPLPSHQIIHHRRRECRSM